MWPCRWELPDTGCVYRLCIVDRVEKRLGCWRWWLSLVEKKELIAQWRTRRIRRVGGQWPRNRSMAEDGPANRVVPSMYVAVYRAQRKTKAEPTNSVDNASKHWCVLFYTSRQLRCYRARVCVCPLGKPVRFPGWRGRRRYTCRLRAEAIQKWTLRRCSRIRCWNSRYRGST